MTARRVFVAALLATGVWSAPAIAGGVHPKPKHANADRGQAYYDGCHLQKAATESPPCVYGDAGSATTVVLFGDSHALHFFPALVRVAERRHWRLVTLTKSGCPPAAIDVYYRSEHRLYSECGVWRDAMLRRIEVEEKPALVVTSGSISTAVLEGGKVLARPQAMQALGRGSAAVAQRLVAAGIRVVAIRDVPKPPVDIPSCVAKHMHHLRHCAFVRRKALPHPDPVAAALRAVDGVRLIDPAKKLCPRRLCPAVVHDILVYRGGGHLTATFAATLAPWLGRKL